MHNPLGALHFGDKNLVNKRLEIKPAFENRKKNGFVTQVLLVTVN